MTKLFAALAAARTRTDANIAFGEAVEWWTRAKTTLLAALAAACVLLAIGYINLHQNVQANTRTLESREQVATDIRTKVFAELEGIRKLLEDISGQRRATAPGKG